MWYKLAILYGLSASLGIFRLRESSCGHNFADYLTESIARYTDTITTPQKKIKSFQTHHTISIHCRSSIQFQVISEQRYKHQVILDPRYNFKPFSNPIYKIQVHLDLLKIYGSFSSLVQKPSHFIPCIQIQVISDFRYKNQVISCPLHEIQVILNPLYKK